MAFQISPGVLVQEVDLTTVVPSVLTTAGAYAGAFAWGPANTIVQVTSETDLVKYFGGPDSNTATSFFTAASFLSYGNNLQVVRAADASSLNATANTQATINVPNKSIFQATYLNQNNANTYGPFISRYSGALGNSLSVSVIDAGAGSTAFNSWTYSSYVNGIPGTSAQAIALNGNSTANDELHIVVIDAGGLFTGNKGQVLEVYQYVSKGFDAKDPLGNSNYYKNKLFNDSKYIYGIDPVNYATTSATWGQTLANTTYATLPTAVTTQLVGGTYTTPSDAAKVTAFSYFTNPNLVDISLVVTGDADTTVQQYVIDNIVTTRKDCVAFISPPSSNVVNQAGSEVTNITAWNTALARSTSYAFADSGWKYMFDKYNNTYRWIPLNGDMAGLCVNTDHVRDAWWSPAGFNRGNLKNVIKLAWNPNQAQRDSLYAQGINPVATFQGQGTVLFGDKTLQAKPSAFDRVNVRRLFIVLEKAIARASQYSMFEFNDSFTQAQFVALVTPFLRDIQGRRGITDFKVVCDSTNNTPQVIDSNKFVGDIYIKPARSINFIQLNFVAVGTGVSFTEVVGQTGV